MNAFMWLSLLEDKYLKMMLAANNTKIELENNLCVKLIMKYSKQQCNPFSFFLFLKVIDIIAFLVLCVSSAFLLDCYICTRKDPP